MTPETFLVVVLMLVVKYTLEFADRRRWRAKRRRGRAGVPRRGPGVRPAGERVLAPPPEAARHGDAHRPTGDPFWDMVNARISALPEPEATPTTDFSPLKQAKPVADRNR